MIETGVYFGNIHSYYDLNLVLAPFVPAAAKPKTEYVDLPGGDGSLDLTEALGEVKFEDRNFPFTFSVHPSDKMTFDEKVSQVSNALNGKKCNIILDRDDAYYWEGRCTVDSYKQDKRLKQIVVSAKVKPYKLKRIETVVTVNIGIIKTNTDGAMTILDVFNLAVGDYKLANDVTGDVVYNLAGTKETKTLTFSGCVTVEQGASTSEKTVVCGGNKYTYDLYLGCIITEITVSTPEITDEIIVTLANGRKAVVPVVTCTDEVTIAFGDVTKTLSAGTHKILDFQLAEGNNVFKVSGAGVTMFKYREGDL